MTHGFDIVSIGTNDECSVVVWVVVRTKSGSAIVLSACCHGGKMELIHLLSAPGDKCEMQVGRTFLRLNESLCS